MCWVGKRKCNIAEEDIIVYKYLDENHNSPYLNYHYCKNKLCERVILEPWSTYKPYIYIYSGYHSYIKIPKVPLLFNSILYKFIIPKGSEYYVNTYGEVVSNQIIFTGEKV